MTDSQKIKGLDWYFRLSEKKYGQRMSHLTRLQRELGDRKHVGMVALLKTEHRMEHGHAPALALIPPHNLARSKRA